MNASRQYPDQKQGERGAILIIVMWIAFGLVSLALYFGHSMVHELRASDNRVAGAQAEQAIEGAARYISLVLSNNPGRMPDLRYYRYEDVPIGDATYWILGRGDAINSSVANTPVFGLTDETGKLNVNNCTRSNLLSLPRMTDNVAGSILNWRDKSNETNSNNSGAATELTYSALNPPYSMKGANFETMGELRLVYGINMDLLYGRDVNLNGLVDYNEKSLDVPTGYDASDATVDSGLLEYLTVYPKDPNLQTNGAARVNVTNMTGMAALLAQNLSDAKLIGNLTNTPSGPPMRSLLEYYVRHINDGLTESQFETIYDSITVSNGTMTGMINVNTASRVALESLDGMTSAIVETLIRYRSANPDHIKSIAWVATALKITALADLPQCHPQLTTHTYQVAADIAALGLHDRGYRRVKYVFDTSSGVPQIIYRQDLTHLGRALGKDIRDQILSGKDLR